MGSQFLYSFFFLFYQAFTFLLGTVSHALLFVPDKALRFGMLSACFIAHGLLFFLLLVLITREKKLRLVFFRISINHMLMN